MRADVSINIGELANSRGFLLRLSRVHVYEQIFRQNGGTQIKPGEFTVLWLLHLNPGVRQGVVARKLHIKPAHMTKLVRRLEEGGIVTRVIPDDDRRSVELTLTDAGRELVANTKGSFFEADDQYQNGLSEQEHQQLIALLTKYVGFDQG